MSTAPVSASTETTLTLNWDFDTDYQGSQIGLPFDTSAIPAGATISAVTLSLYGVSSVIDSGPWTLNVYVFDFGAAISLADWQQPSDLQALTEVGSLGTGDYSDSAYNDIAIDPSAITKGGTTKFWLADARNESDTAPTDDYSIVFDSNDTGGETTGPKLVIEYTAPTIPPLANHLRKLMGA